MAQFDETIDAMDEILLREFHRKLVEGGCYEGQLNPETIDETSIEHLRQAVKLGVQSTSWEKLKQIAPESIKKEIEALGANTIAAPSPQSHAEDDTGETKERLFQELTNILSNRDRRGGVPPILRERFGEILTTLNKKHGMNYQDIETTFDITRKTVSKTIENFQKWHPIITPDEKVLKGSEKATADKLIKVVGAAADEIIESDMELAIHIRQTYLKEAYLRGMTLRQLVDVAVNTWFKTGDIYQAMLEMERGAAELRDHNRQLEVRVSQLSHKNRSLTHTLMNINRL